MDPVDTGATRQESGSILDDIVGVENRTLTPGAPIGNPLADAEARGKRAGFWLGVGVGVGGMGLVGAIIYFVR